MHTTLPEEAGTAGRRRNAMAGGAFNVRRESLPPLAPSLLYPAEGTKKRGRAMKLSHVNGMKKWMLCDGQRLISDVRKQL